MAISIDTVYQKVLALANKEQRGYITPQEFNLFADMAQKEIFEQYFYDVNQWTRQHGNSLGYSDMLVNLQEKISLFEFTAVGDNVTVLNRWGDINLENSANIYRLGSVFVKYPENRSYVEAELVDDMKEFKLLAESKLTRHSRKRPVYLRYYSNYDRIKIYPYPVEDDGSDIDLNTKERDPSVASVNVDSVTYIGQASWGVGKYMFFNEAAMIGLLGVDYSHNEVFNVKVVRIVSGVDVVVYDGEMEFFDSSSPSLTAQYGVDGGVSSARKYPHYNGVVASSNLNAKAGDWEVGDTVYVTSNRYLGDNRNVRVDYIRNPKTPNWSYIMVNEKALYNSTASIDFDLHSAEESELVYRILALAGIAINKPQLTQVAAALEQAKVQQEKQ